MTSEGDPIIGSWYHYPEKSQKFCVTAIDEQADKVEIQYFDGNLDEFDLSAWGALDIERIEAPEDWTGPMNSVEKDDLSAVGTEMQDEDWEAPFREDEEKTHAGPRDTESEPEDDWAEGHVKEEHWEEPK